VDGCSLGTSFSTDAARELDLDLCERCEEHFPVWAPKSLDTSSCADFLSKSLGRLRGDSDLEVSASNASNFASDENSVLSMRGAGDFLGCGLGDSSVELLANRASNFAKEVNSARVSGADASLGGSLSSLASRRLLDDSSSGSGVRGLLGSKVTSTGGIADTTPSTFSLRRSRASAMRLSKSLGGSAQ